MQLTEIVGLDAIIVGDDPAAWVAGGFDVDDGAIAVAAMTVQAVGDGRVPGWWLCADDPSSTSSADVDGIPTTFTAPNRRTAGTSHPNGVTGLDHVVIASPDLDRTTETFASLGVECRRIRQIPGSDPAMEQRFFRLGPAIVEMVGTTEPTGDGPATIWGLAFVVDDIDETAKSLGEACTAPKGAVQPGRRIATLKTRDLGISVPVAFMTPHVRG